MRFDEPGPSRGGRSTVHEDLYEIPNERVRHTHTAKQLRDHVDERKLLATDGQMMGFTIDKSRFNGDGEEKQSSPSKNRATGYQPRQTGR